MPKPAIPATTREELEQQLAEAEAHERKLREPSDTATARVASLRDKITSLDTQEERERKQRASETLWANRNVVTNELRDVAGQIDKTFIGVLVPLLNRERELSLKVANVFQTSPGRYGTQGPVTRSFDYHLRRTRTEDVNRRPLVALDTIRNAGDRPLGDMVGSWIEMLESAARAQEQNPAA